MNPKRLGLCCGSWQHWMVASVFVSKICNFWQDGWFYGEIMAPWRPGKGSINYIVPLDPKGKSRNLIKNCLAGLFRPFGESVWIDPCCQIQNGLTQSVSKDSWKLQFCTLGHSTRQFWTGAFKCIYMFSIFRCTLHKHLWVGHWVSKW